MKIKTQLFVFALVVAFGWMGFFGYNMYQNHQTQKEVDVLKAYSFGEFLDDIADIPNDILYAGYKIYMHWVDDGVKGGDGKLSAELIKRLHTYYAYDLSKVKYAYTTRFKNLGMTDCKQIYFGQKDIVDKLKKGASLSDGQYKWLFHELVHGGQCNRWGGREKYAKTWFKQVRKSVLKNIQKGNFVDIIKDLNNAAELAKYDDDMSMEEEAQTRSEKILKFYRARFKD